MLRLATEVLNRELVDARIFGRRNKNATCMGWRFSWNVLGGPGRNRTTDTRIFKTRLYRTRKPWTSATS